MREFVMALVVLVFIMVGIYWSKYYQCHWQAQAMQLECTYALFVGCMVKTKDGKWVPLQNYRVID